MRKVFAVGVGIDRAGRKPAMILSFLLMGVGLVGLALTPSYSQIGVTAPILLVLFRLLQGFALGVIFRRTLPETLKPADHRASSKQRRVSVKLIVLAVPMLMASTVCGYGSSRHTHDLPRHAGVHAHDETGRIQ